MPWSTAIPLLFYVYGPQMKAPAMVEKVLDALRFPQKRDIDMYSDMPDGGDVLLKFFSLVGGVGNPLPGVVGGDAEVGGAVVEGSKGGVSVQRTAIERAGVIILRCIRALWDALLSDTSRHAARHLRWLVH